MAKAQAQEPSMEEILASIRRIIADEEKPPVPAPVPSEDATEERISEDDLDKLFASAGEEDDEAEPAPEEEQDDVLDLTEENVAAELVDNFAFEEEDLQFADPDPEPEPEPEPVPAPRPAPVAAAPPPRLAPDRPAFEPRLISEATDKAVSSAFDSLSLMVINRNARTLEDLVEDMLRPMLKGWLDENLPPMVERMVKAEIDRVTRGR